MDGLKSVAESSIYYHTHRFLQRHQFLVPEPANDFAYWASAFLGHDPLGRALEAVDTLGYASLEDLRSALIRATISCVWDEPAKAPADPRGKRAWGPGGRAMIESSRARVTRRRFQRGISRREVL